MSDFRENTPQFDHAKGETKGGALERKKFATQMDAALLERLRAHAKSEGRQIQAILEDAVEGYLKDKQGYVMRPDVKAAHEYTLKRFGKVFEALAK